MAVCRGRAATVPVACIGHNPIKMIKPGDEILTVLEFSTEAAIVTMVDRTSLASIVREGYITLSACTTTADSWLVFWHALNGGPSVGYLRPKVALVTGGAAGALTATGIGVGDTIIGVVELTTAAAIASMKDLTEYCTVTAANEITCSVATTSNQLIVFFHDCSATDALEYHRPKFSVLAGAAATTNIAVTGAAVLDSIWACLHFTTAASIATLVDLSVEPSFTSAGNMQMSTTDTTSDALLLIWNDAS